MEKDILKEIDKEIDEINRTVDEEMSLPCVCGHFKNVHCEGVCLYCGIKSTVHSFKLDNFAFIKQHAKRNKS